MAGRIRTNVPLHRHIALTLIAIVGVCFMAGCTPPQPPVPSPRASPDQARDLEHAPPIGVGTEQQVAEVGVNAELALWLNTIDSSGASEPPVPSAEAWQQFSMPSAADFVLFSTGRQTSFDVLEILAYPDGLDEGGAPATVEVHPLCGSQANVSCSDVARGSSDVLIPADVVASAIADTEYYAIGGVMLPEHDSHPMSFMALMKKKE